MFCAYVARWETATAGFWGAIQAARCDWSVLPVTASQRLTALPRMLTGCHSAFPSDLVHVYGFHWGRQHLSSSTAEQVLLRRGGAAESLSHSSKHTHTHTHRHTLHRTWKNLEEHLTDLYFTFTASLGLPNIFCRCFT